MEAIGMSRKFSAARRAAFLRAVGETGNQTLAAERAKVSRSWVTMTRAAEPEFDAAVRAAVAAARERLRVAGGRPSTSLGTSDETVSRKARHGHERIPNRPQTGWGHFDGAELVVRGTNGRRAQIARARIKGWSPKVEARFLAALAATCNVKAACAAVELSAASAYQRRNRGYDFAERWDAAIEEGYARLEAGLVEAGCNYLSGEAPLPEVTVSAITAAEALHLLHMHKHQVLGLGKRPGGAPAKASNAEIIAALRKRLRQFGVKV
jgi:hypothetical protein